ncbi:hypothetical protein GPECTOR_153g61 [Gonium pectorale]|uniref:Integrase catalytic domain-containing protein n=1 Tax=Gonium pectorale TaxID=33097 RepID=A0A150FXS4_GONPE|nr:hypothetical protein GPECTOR_153g61 [Gonium pectorale]|eukprot:KXZ42388.1 hypothetical protein GPECTOR_153g61 [Gonium pectorale]
MSIDALSDTVLLGYLRTQKLPVAPKPTGEANLRELQRLAHKGRYYRLCGERLYKRHVIHRLTASYTPQTNGQVERLVGVMVDGLRKMVN